MVGIVQSHQEGPACGCQGCCQWGPADDKRDVLTAAKGAASVEPSDKASGCGYMKNICRHWCVSAAGMQHTAFSPPLWQVISPLLLES